MWANLKTTFGSGKSSAGPACYKVGTRVRLGPSLGDFTGYIVQAPSSPAEQQTYEVELYAPEELEDDALNPFLVQRRLTGVKAAEMRPCADSEGAGLSAVGRPGASMCSVPLAELDQRGLGPNAAGRYARIGGLSSRPDLNGLTCTVLGGPTDQGRYSVELAMEDEGNSILLLRPDCLTLRLRRGVLQELVAPVAGRRPAVAAAPVRNQVAAAEPDPVHAEEESDEEEQQEADPRADAPRGQRSSSAAREGVASSTGRTSARNKASPAATAALEAAARAARERKFDELDAYLARCCADEKDAPGLANATKGPTACLPKSPARGLPSPDPVDAAVATLAKGEGAGQKVSKRALKDKKPKRRHSAPPKGTPAQTVQKSLTSEDEQADGESVSEAPAPKEKPRRRSGSAGAARPPRIPEKKDEAENS